MPWDQTVGISGLKTSMAVEGNPQADVSELRTDIISRDKLNVDSEVIDLGTGMTLKENVGTDTSSLASGEKMTNDSERNNAAGDASMDSAGVEKSQQAHVTELSRVLPSNENLKDNPELRKDDVREEAKVCDASELLSTMKGEYGNDDIETNVPGNVAEVPDASNVPGNVVRDETEKPDASRTCGPAKGEDGDVSKTISLMQDQDDDDTEIRTNKLINEGGAGLNSPPVLSKCSFAVHGVVLAAQNREGQSESKRLVVSRERKQSKYLSPPYVNLSKGLKGSDQENFTVLGVEEGSDLHGSSPPASKSGSKGKKRELSTKSVVSAGNLQDISASSGELLSELHLAALDCLYACEKKYFDPIELFFSIFRCSVFRDKSNFEADKKDTGVRNEKELVGGICEENASDMEIKSEAKKRKRKEKPSNGSTTNLLPASLNGGNVSVAPTPPFAVDYAPTGVPVIREAKPTTPNSLDFSEKGTCTNSESLDFSKDLRKAISVSFEDTEAVSIPDLKGNSMSSNVLAAGSQSEGPFVLTGMSEPKKRGRKKGIVRAITNPVGNDGFMNSEGLAAGSQSESPSVLTGMSKRGRKKGTVCAITTITNPDGNDNSMNSGGLAAGSQSESPSVLTGMSGLKKRGRKKGTVLANTSPDGNSNSMNSNELAAGSQSEDPPVLTGTPAPKKRGSMERKKGTVRSITNPDGNDSSMNSKGLATGSQSEGPSVLTGMSGLKRQGGKKGTVLANTSPDGNGNPMNSNGLAAGSQSEDPSVPNGMPAPRKRGSMERTVLANTNPDGNHERKKRRRRRKDGTYADDLPNADAHILNTTPISLEVCLRNVEPTTPAPMCPLNTSPSPDALPGEAPSLDQMKKSLGLMTTMLERSWNNLLPEMKGTIEIEVQGLLKKINTMSSSSSS